MALVGTISGSNGTSTTAISGTLIIADSPANSFPSLAAGVKLFVSGNKTTLGADTPNSIFGGDTFVSGAFGTDSYIQMKPVTTLTIPTNTTASYIYTSGSTNDLYFTQYSGAGLVNTTRLRWLEGALATGLQYGGILSTQIGSTTFSVTSGSGIIINQNASINTEPYPTIGLVTWPQFVSASLVYSGTSQVTYVAINSAGGLEQLNTPPTLAQYKDRIILGRVLHQTGSVSNGAINSPAVSFATAANIFDFIRPFGPLKVNGHILTASGSTLGLLKSAGDSYSEGRNYSVDPSAPNTILASQDVALTNSKIFYQYVSGSTAITNTGVGNAGFAVIDPGQYNNNGTLSPVGNSEWTNQRVYWFPASVGRALFVYYGSVKYGTLLAAVAAIDSENFTEGENTRDAAVFVGTISVKGNETNLSDTVNAKISQAGLFRGAFGGGGGGGVTPPAGSTTQVQFNDAGAFGGDSGLTYDKTTDSLTVVGDITGSNLRLTGDTTVVGGDMLSSATIFNFIPSGSTGNTLNIGETTGVIQIGKATGPTTVRLAYGNTVSPSVKTVEIGVNGAAGSTTNITLGASAGSGRTTFNNDIALSTGNIIGAPGAGANVMTLVSSGNIIARLDTDNSGPGHKFAIQDYLNADKFSVAETGDAEIASTLFVTGSATTSGSLRSVQSVGSEGGEIFLSSPASSTSINTGVNIDVYQNKFRIFESGGTSRGGYYDITALDASSGSDLLRGDPLAQFLYRRYLSVQGSDGNSNNVSTIGTSAGFTQNGGTAVLGNADSVIRYTTTTTVDTSARWRTPNVFLRIGHTGRFRFRIVTGTSIASETIIMGIQSDDAYTYNAAGRHAVTIVYDSATSANWLLFTKDGTTGNAVDTGVAVATSTSYSFDVKFTASTASLAVNGGTAVSTSSNMPAAATDLYFLCGIGNRSGGATRDFSFLRAVLECGS